jgi:hypothetical protein
MGLLLRVVVGVGLFAVGYYVGRAVERRESLSEAAPEAGDASAGEGTGARRDPEFNDGET